MLKQVQPRFKSETFSDAPSPKTGGSMLPVAKKFLEPSPGLCVRDTAVFDGVSIACNKSGKPSELFSDASPDGTTAICLEGVTGASVNTDWYWNIEQISSIERATNAMRMMRKRIMRVGTQFTLGVWRTADFGVAILNNQSSSAFTSADWTS